MFNENHCNSAKVIYFFLQIFGLRSSNGHIEWEYFVPELFPFDRYGQQKMLLFVQRTTAHFPHPPQCVVIGKHKVSSNTVDGFIFVGTISFLLNENDTFMGIKIFNIFLHNSHRILYTENFLPHFIFALFALWSEGKFKTELIELYILTDKRKDTQNICQIIHS